MSNVLVFCSASSSLSEDYTKLAYDFGKSLAQHGHRLIYGGASVGLMGSIAQGCIDEGGKVTGVLPEFLTKREVQMKSLDELILTKSMHERKEILYQKCDCAISLPGGYGTLDESFEFMTWNQLALHDKPLAFYNYKGFYNLLIKFNEHLKNEKFVKSYDSYEPAFFNEENEVLEWIK